MEFKNMIYAFPTGTHKVEKLVLNIYLKISDQSQIWYGNPIKTYFKLKKIPPTQHKFFT